MRVDCKNYESRTYPSGETVRMCRIDLAPEAPWRCPENCPGYVKKMSDGGWVHGSLANRHPEDEPSLDEHTISMLDDAENIINSIGPDVIAEEEKRRAEMRPKKKRWWWPF